VMLVVMLTLTQLYWMSKRLNSFRMTPLAAVVSQQEESQQTDSSTACKHQKDHQQGHPSLLNLETIRTTLLAEAPWAESHGGDHDRFLGKLHRRPIQ
jgi:hypothetical protein